MNITEVTLNEGIQAIGSHAFYGGDYLERVNLPSAITTVDKYTFYNCFKLGNIEIPDSVASINDYAFHRCNSLYTEIGNGVETIGQYSFYNCTSLTNQTFPSTLTTIGSYAFAGCSSFTEINIPQNVTSLGDYTFANCSKVEKITLEEGLKTIGQFAFQNINKVTNLTIPTTITSMGASLFSGMSALEELTVPFVGRDQTIYRGTSYKDTEDYRHYPLGYMFGATSYANALSVYQYAYSYDYIKTNANNTYYSYHTDLTTRYYIPATLKKVNVTNTVVFKDYNGTVLSENTYHYGDTIVVPSNPTRSSDAQYVYTFNGWDKEISETCLGDAEYTATYTQSKIEDVVSSQNGGSGCSGNVSAGDSAGNVLMTSGISLIVFAIFILKRKRKVNS